ncbi:hypothetical protein OG291_03175 [Streptomyces halstedii]|uniref:hypothetical protein n=1 Tax=Streptomyces halstedii TaxID=1944 RepID=UPI00386D2B14|nr:hypothetical protein OG291_03175 [Streptomyces halstedii]
MTTHTLSAAIRLSGAAVASALQGAAGLGLILVLAAFVVPQVLNIILNYRVRAATLQMQANAVAKTRAADLPALFRAFTPVEVKTDPPDSPDGASP